MFISRFTRKIRLNSLNRCKLCSQAIENVPVKEPRPRATRKTQIFTFLDNSPDLKDVRNVIPDEIICSKMHPERLYLMCPKIAKEVAARVLTEIKKNPNQIVCESNPGLGFITEELLKGGVKKLKTFESNIIFEGHLMLKFNSNRDSIDFCSVDINNVNRYGYLDSMDRKDRVLDMFEGVPRKDWNDDAVMTIVGTMSKRCVIKYFYYALADRSGVTSFGRTDMFFLTYPKYWAILTDLENIGKRYRFWGLLSNLFFDVELLGKYDRKLFIPWPYRLVKDIYPLNLDLDKMYFIKISMKKKLDLPDEQVLPFITFLRCFVKLKNRPVIPTIEGWVPNCGKNIIAPKLNHKDYFNDIDIFTTFSDLTPKQTIAIFREMTVHPNYKNSVFLDMIEKETTDIGLLDDDEVAEKIMDDPDEESINV